MFTLIERTKKMIQRARLERALLLEKVEHVAKAPAEETTPPQSPPLSVANEEESGEASAKKGGNKLPNAYTVFCDEERAAVQESLASSGTPPKANSVQKALSDKWKQLGKDDRKPYAEKARELKKKGEEESE